MNHKITILTGAVAIALPSFFLVVPSSAQSLPDQSAAFESYQEQDRSQFERQKAMNNAPDGLDEKKAQMDKRFGEMKKQFDENGKKMGQDNGFMGKKSKQTLDTNDFQKNDPATNLNDLKEKSARENDILSGRGMATISDEDESSGEIDDEPLEPESTAPKTKNKMQSFVENHGIALFIGSVALLCTMMFLFVQGTKDSEKAGEE